MAPFMQFTWSVFLKYLHKNQDIHETKMQLHNIIILSKLRKTVILTHQKLLLIRLAKKRYFDGTIDKSRCKYMLFGVPYI